MATDFALKIQKGDKVFLVSNLNRDEATLGELRRRAAALTGVPIAHQKLVGLGAASATLSDDVKLKSLKLRNGSRIVVFRTEKAAAAATSSAPPPPPAGDAEAARLQAIRSAVDALDARVATLESAFVATERRAVDGELERALLQLDQVSVASSDELRAARKEQVTRVQQLLAQLDALQARFE